MRYSFTTLMAVTLELLLCVAVLPAWAQDAPPPLPLSMTKEPPLYLRAKGYDYDHEILVALPASYDSSPDKKYPVLWTMDGSLLQDLYVGTVNYFSLSRLVPEMIVVSVGHRSAEGLAGFFTKRTIDLFTADSWIAEEGVAADFLTKSGMDLKTLFTDAKADLFLDFLVDQARPALSKKYRMADDHAVFGHSAGGAFVSYALFARPGAFTRFGISSGTNPIVFDMEREYANNHTDLKASVFIGAGVDEMTELGMAGQSTFRRPMQLGETLNLRTYPSLRLTTRAYPGKGHGTVLPLTISEGLQFLYADVAAPPP